MRGHRRTGRRVAPDKSMPGPVSAARTAYDERSSAPKSRASRSAILATTSLASASVRVRSDARRSTEKARLFLPLGSGGPAGGGSPPKRPAVLGPANGVAAPAGREGTPPRSPPRPGPADRRKQLLD